MATDTATVDGTLNLVSGSFNIGTLAARGPINQASTSGSGTGTLRIDGSTDQTFTGSATAVPGAGALPNLGGRQELGHAQPGRHHPDRAQLTYTTGLVDPGTSPGRPDRRHAERGDALSRPRPARDGHRVATDTATVDGTLNLVSGSFNIGTLAARGPINQASTSGSGTGTLRIDGSTDRPSRARPPPCRASGRRPTW